ncbi:MAG: hypothetical protein ACRC8S_08050 [Fimbriiglobus sp.]
MFYRSGHSQKKFKAVAHAMPLAKTCVSLATVAADVRIVRTIENEFHTANLGIARKFLCRASIPLV